MRRLPDTDMTCCRNRTSDLWILSLTPHQLGQVPLWTFILRTDSTEQRSLSEWVRLCRGLYKNQTTSQTRCRNRFIHAHRTHSRHLTMYTSKTLTRKQCMQTGALYKWNMKKMKYCYWSSVMKYAGNSCPYRCLCDLEKRKREWTVDKLNVENYNTFFLWNSFNFF